MRSIPGFIHASKALPECHNITCGRPGGPSQITQKNAHEAVGNAMSLSAQYGKERGGTEHNASYPDRARQPCLLIAAAFALR
jgi:hypothetical protein